MERTKTRPTVTGKYKPGFALTFGLVILLLGFVFLLLTTPMAVLMGFIGAFHMLFYIVYGQRESIH